MKLCSKTKRPILLNKRGRNMQRYCIVNGKGLTNARFESFHLFCNFAGIDKCIKLRTEHFQEAHKAIIEGYEVEMFYHCEDVK